MSERVKWDASAEQINHLIESGQSDQIIKLEPPWLRLYQQVGAADGGRLERQAAFTRALRDEPLAERIYWSVVMCDPVENTTKISRDTLHTAADALGPPPPVRWLAQDLITQPSLNLLVGEPGSKKTWLALDLAVCAALGAEWLGHQVSPTPALFIDEESGTPRLWSRLHQVLHGHEAPAETPLFWGSLAGYDLRTEQDAKRLQAKIERTQAGFIVIDALVDVMQGGDENSVQDVQPVFHHLRQIAADSEAAILLLHHTNKQGGYRGSSSMLGAVDLMLALDSPQDSTRLHLKTLKARDILPTQFSARAYFEDGQFWLSKTSDRPKPKLTAAASGLLDVLSHGSANTAELVAALEGSAESTVKKEIHQMMKAGAIERADKGGPGAMATYALTENGNDLLLSLKAE